MSTALRQMLAAAMLLVCGTALVPPPGFALCIDADGHLVVEAASPGPARCCVGPDTGADEACDPSSCADCIDIAIAAGDVSVAKQSRDADGGPLAQTSAPQRCAIPCTAGPHQVPEGAAFRVAPPPLRTISLRI